MSFEQCKRMNVSEQVKKVVEKLRRRPSQIKKEKSGKRKQFAALTILCILLVLIGAWWLDSKIPESSKPEIDMLREQQQEQLEIIEQLLEEVMTMRQESEEMLRQMRDWLDKWEIKPVEVSAYAPLDARAVEGMCYSGNPNITASGAPVVIGETAAAGPSVTFGTRAWIENIGFRTITDRGGRIGDGNIDLVVETQEEAFEIGRKTVKAVYQK